MKLVFFLLSLIFMVSHAKFGFRHTSHGRMKLRTKHQSRLRHRNRQDASSSMSSSSMSSSSMSSSSSFSSSSSSSVSMSSSSTVSMPVESKQDGGGDAQSSQNWKESLIQGPHEYPCPALELYEKAMKGAGSGLDLTSPDAKRKEMKKLIFSLGDASYFYDLLDPFFLSDFEANTKKAFAAFAEVQPEESGIGKAQKPKPNDGKLYVSLKQIMTGAKKFNWVFGRKPKKAQEAILIPFDFANKDHLDFKEFTYFNIRENIKNEVPGNCENCLNAIKLSLKNYFQYLNCDNSGYITAEGLFLAMKNMKLQFQVTGSMTNKFFLNVMEQATATIDKREFIYGMLMGMFERVITSEGPNNENLDMMKQARLDLIKEGNGPK